MPSKPKKPKVPKRRSMPAFASINKSGAGPHKTDDEKRVQNKERKEIEEQSDDG